MATATARNVDDKDYAALAEMAAANGRSISEELRALIAEAARKRRLEELMAKIREIRERNPLRLVPGEDAVSLIRAIRDEE
ncbi:ribbon-helix-helix protein, CopG family [Novosphingobium sp. NDB2Meth1]|uniref:FitA-like ribbon-helix-helix domain-containing protein n=1 Tax=Novosphingobium sp. NDB2Meth1 TaxID=1892847 RepID=UPI000931040E|nr:ribbon-helix-helix protein, CopG family [Novosphingobium sp. NDB2Meth1]